MFDTEDLIAEIEMQPAIWNTVHEDYNNKNSKKTAWECVVRKFTLNFDELDTSQKNNIVLRCQRKWKSLRDCFTRELLKKKKEKSGSATASRKQYIYFKNLSFLLSLPKSISTLEDEETNQDFQEITVKEEILQEPEEVDIADSSVKKRPNKSKRNKDTTEEDELFAMLKEKVMKYSEQEDDDKLFMLSLVPELRRIPENEKLDIKIELMNVFKRARYQQYDNLNDATDPEQQGNSFGQQMPHLEPADQSEHSWCSPTTNKPGLSPDSESVHYSSDNIL